MPPLDEKSEVLVLGLSQTKPKNAVELGQVKINSAGASRNSTYDAVIERAKLEARKSGGNVLKIVQHRLHTADGLCHSITALILKVDDPTNYKPIEEEIIQNADYAIFNVYMPIVRGNVDNYDLYLGDSILYNVGNNSRTTLYIKKDGLDTLRATIDATREMPITIEFGKTYYVRCGVNTEFEGLLLPEIDLIDWQTGKAEFETINSDIR